MSSFEKYRVHEVAKDFGLSSKVITEILTKYATAPKNHMQVLEDQEIAKILSQEVSALKERYRIVVVLHYAMDLTAGEIADILKIPRGTVESRLYKARKILRERMEEHGYEVR